MNVHFLIDSFGKPSFLCPIISLSILVGCGGEPIACDPIAAEYWGCTITTQGSSTPPPPPLPPVYVWISATTTVGAMGGVNGADTICVNDSSGITFNTAVTTHRAIIGVNNPPPSANPRPIVANRGRPVERPDGTPIIGSWRDFFDNSVTAVNTIGGGTRLFWTGLNANASSASGQCLGWTGLGGGLAGGMVGAENRTNQGRYSERSRLCSVAYSVLCVSF